MKYLKRLWFWWMEKRWSEARKHSSQWKREALMCLRGLQRVEKKLKSARSDFDQKCGDAERKIGHARSSYESVVNEVESRVKEAQNVVAKYDHTEEKLSNELEVYRDVVVPQLTLAAEMGRQQMEAEIALQVQRQVYYSGSNQPKE